MRQAWPGVRLISQYSLRAERSAMVSVKKLVLDVLKPHQPNALEFSQTLAAVGSDYRVHLTVLEVDENTETLRVICEGRSLDFDGIQASINKMGGSLHSIDEVEVRNEADTGQ
jgi:hypothetical protein